MRKRTKSKTLTGKRIPEELNLEVINLQRQARAVGKRLSQQDAMRRIVNEFRRRK